MVLDPRGEDLEVAVVGLVGAHGHRSGQGQQDAAKDSHELMRAWEAVHRYFVGEACARTRLARKESRWPGYYYKYDYLKLDDTQKNFINVKYDVEKKEWTTFTRPMINIL